MTYSQHYVPEAALNPTADSTGHLLSIVRVNVTIKMISSLLRRMSQLSIFVYLRDFYCWGEGGFEEFELAFINTDSCRS